MHTQSGLTAESIRITAFAIQLLPTHLSRN